METVKHEMAMTSFPSNERVDTALSGLESRLRLAATSRESYAAVAVVAHQLFDLTSARLGIVAADDGRSGSTPMCAECHELSDRGIDTAHTLVELTATAYGQVVASGCADYEPLASSLVLPVEVDGSTSFLQLVKSGTDSFAFDDFEIADRFVALLARELHAFKRRPAISAPADEERSPLGVRAPDSLSDVSWRTDVIAHH